MKPFRNTEIARLAHELLLSPSRYRLRQVAGIVRAIELVDPAREYPYSFVCFQITGYRPRRTPDDSMLDGKSLAADLAALLDRLTVANPLPAEAAEGRLYDIDALAARFNVSTKTISRWRSRGLAGCWYSGEAGKPCLAFAAPDIERFVARHRDMVRRGAAFAVMTAEERDGIISRARELVASHQCGLHAATVRLAQETGRAIETIRYTLRRFDRDHPAEALFDRAEQGHPLEESALIYEAFRAGDSTREIATRFNKRETEIRRVITRARCEELAAKPLSYVYNPVFDSPDAEPMTRSLPAFLLPKNREIRRDELLVHEPTNLPPYLRELYRTPLLSREEESDSFRQMNCLLHQAELRRRRLDPQAATPEDIAAIDDLLEQAGTIRNALIQANLRLVVGIAKRHLYGRPAANLFELISDGNLALMRAVDGFDFVRGCRFSTYASWVIIRGFARSIPQELAQAGTFQTGREELLSAARDHRETEADQDGESAVRDALADALRLLDGRERNIVERHFGLSGGSPAETLKKIGCRIGLSKERIRQIEQQAFAKLRAALGDRVELLVG